ncbi:MAG: hypothetical protein DMG10_02170 [Acidobacteria bacterium]|nr:MAG: hypothetical protein DMG10_02170 [Acidobacteriota bacterium]
MRLAVGSDHAGFELKETLAAYLRESGHEVIDIGTRSTDVLGPAGSRARRHEYPRDRSARRWRGAGPGAGARFCRGEVFRRGAASAETREDKSTRSAVPVFLVTLGASAS